MDGGSSRHSALPLAPAPSASALLGLRARVTLGHPIATVSLSELKIWQIKTVYSF